MKYFVILLICILSFTIPYDAFALEENNMDYFSNSEFDKFYLVIDDYEFVIPYKISNATLSNIVMDCESKSLSVDIYRTDAGTLTLHLPRSLIDSKIDSVHNDIFNVLSDTTGKKIEFENLETTNAQTVTVKFPTVGDHIDIFAQNTTANSNDCAKIQNIPYSYKLSSPLQQQRSGISPENIHCKEGLMLAFQLGQDKSACVTPSTLDKLIERRWAQIHQCYGSFFLIPEGKHTISCFCDANQIMINGGYYTEKDSPLEFEWMKTIEKSNKQGIEVALANPEERRQHAASFADCRNMHYPTLNDYTQNTDK